MEAIEYKNIYEVEEDHFWFVGMRRIAKVLLDKIVTKKDMDILDAGCGTGMNLVFLGQYGKVRGVDISDYAICCCRERGFKNVKVASIDKLPFPDHSFDLVTSFDVLNQNDVIDPKEALREVARVLKPQGLFLIRVSAYKWLRSVHDVMTNSTYRYTSSELNRLLAECGFTTLRSTYANTFLFPLAALRRLQGKLLPCAAKSSDVRPLPQAVNYVFKLPFMLEAFLIKFISLPVGLIAAIERVKTAELRKNAV